jgi:integrase
MPSWRGRARNPATGRSEWQRPVVKSRGEVLAWLGTAAKGADHLAELAARGPTLESLGDEWLDGVERGRIGRRRGRGKPYSETTIEGMRRSWLYHLRPEFGPRVAEEITEMDWQRWIDELARKGLSRSTIAQHVSVASGIYAWAAAPSRRLVPRNPLQLVELPPNDEKPRMRVALAPEAAALLAALEPEDRLPYAIAFYAGLRRSEIYRLDWQDVLEGNRIATRVLVMRSKSEAGTQRRAPDRRHAPRDPRRRLGAPGSPARRQGGRPVGDVGEDRRSRDRRLGCRRPTADHAPRVPPHLRLAAHGGRLHDQGAHGVHGPRGPADGQPLREVASAARRG